MKERFYEQMCLIRLFEEKLGELFTRGDLFGTTHACIGQEAVAVGVASALNKDDVITSNHRGHGHYLAFTDDVDGLMAELMGKKTGICAGRSGSQHLCKGGFYSNGITGGMTAVATGMALAEKLKKSNKIVVAFFGDGALGEGVLYESLNMASLWDLPIVYVLENNYYAMSTHISAGVAGKMIDRGRAFGIEAKEMTGNDVELIYATFKEIADDVRNSSRPYFFVVNTYRQCGHSKSDDCSYRSREEENNWKNSDPLKVMDGRISEAVMISIREKCQKRIEDAVENAKAAGFPDTSAVHEGIFR